MAVASRGAALSAFRELINNDPVEARSILRRPYLPDGLEPSDDQVGMDPSTLIGGYGNEARYTLGGEDPATRLAIAGPPADVLSGRPSITQWTRLTLSDGSARSHESARPITARPVRSRYRKSGWPAAWNWSCAMAADCSR